MVTKFNQVIQIEKDRISKNDWNPNVVSKKMQATIIDDIRKNGFIGEIVVQKHNKELKRDYVIINGEHRYDALVELGETTIPCIVLNISDKKAKTLSIRLNREHGDLAPDKLTSILLNLSPNRDMVFLQNETGISLDELNVLTEIDFNENLLEEPKKKEKVSKEETVTCPKCMTEFKVKK